MKKMAEKNIMTLVVKYPKAKKKWGWMQNESLNLL